MKKTLQVKIGENWKYVFCYDEHSKLITTEIKSNAITGDNHSLNFFQSKFGNNEFRIK